MAKIGQAQDEAMEAILASIRSMMSDDDSPVSAPRASTPPAQLPHNVSKLFSEPPARAEAAALDPAEEELRSARPTVDGRFERRSPEFVSPAPDLAVERAMTRAMEQARAEIERSGTALVEEPTRQEEPQRVAAARPEPELTPHDRVTRPDPADTRGSRPLDAPRERPSAPPLLSSAAGAAVAGAFSELATSMLSGGGRTIDDLVEDLLRPMLRDWLDDNLPPLVERLVREEIERVSRGRR